jgi:hypothetical protein
MPKNKSQHFVPQHYLRQFRIGRTKLVAMARIEPFLLRPASIKDQCKQDYFYGDDGDLDDLLQNFEKGLAPVLLRVSQEEKFDAQDIMLLGMLSVVLHMRTRKVIDNSKVFDKHIAHFVIKSAIERGDLPEPEGGLTKDLIDFKGAASRLIGCVIPCWLETFTLHFKLIKTENSNRFITSDNPVVILNQYFQNLKSPRSYAGYTRSGFQLLLPISPTLCIFFYDPQIYKVGTRKSNVVPISAEDVEIVNSLQIQSAERCLYSNEASMEHSVSRLVEKYIHLRENGEQLLKEIPGRNVNETLVHHRTESARLPKIWSFCKPLRYPNVGSDKRRDPAWSEMISKLILDIEENRTKESVFTRIDRIVSTYKPNVH